MLASSVFTDGGTGLRAERAQSLDHLALRPGERVLQIVAIGAPKAFIAVPALPGIDDRSDLALHRATSAQCVALPGGSFDAVVLHEVLERIDDPCACLREAHRLARSGGRIAIYGRFLPDGFEPPQWGASRPGWRRNLRASPRSFAEILFFSEISARLTWHFEGMRGSGFRAFELSTAA